MLDKYIFYVYANSRLKKTSTLLLSISFKGKIQPLLANLTGSYLRCVKDVNLVSILKKITFKKELQELNGTIIMQSS